MAKDADTRPKFRGFRSPNYTQVPDELFDELLADLSGAELKVLLYIIRRTFGFKKESDNISLSQITSGIETRDGEVLDRGTGLSKSSVAAAVKSLENLGILVRVRQRSDQKGDEPTTYSLNGLPVSKNRTPPGLKIGHPPVQELDTQETVRQQTDFDLSKIRKAPHDFVDNSGDTRQRRASAAGNQPGGMQTIGEVLPTSRFGATVAARQRHTEQAAEEAVPPANGAVEGAGRAPTGRTVARRRSQPRRPVYDEDREVLLAFIQDFSREFNDRAPLTASVTRAYNLLHSSGLPREAFLDRLYQARSITKERSASVRTHAGKDGQGLPTKNKMAYFFAVLEDLLGLAPERDDRAPSG